MLTGVSLKKEEEEMERSELLFEERTTTRATLTMFVGAHTHICAVIGTQR
jgi:hypothetical protein